MDFLEILQLTEVVLLMQLLIQAVVALALVVMEI